MFMKFYKTYVGFIYNYKKQEKNLRTVFFKLSWNETLKNLLNIAELLKNETINYSNSNNSFNLNYN